jgi:hypothetical protein
VEEFHHALRPAMMANANDRWGWSSLVVCRPFVGIKWGFDHTTDSMLTRRSGHGTEAEGSDSKESTISLDGTVEIAVTTAVHVIKCIHSNLDWLVLIGREDVWCVICCTCPRPR